MTCGQCAAEFSSPWLLLRHVHAAHDLSHHQICTGASDELQSAVSTAPTSRQPGNGAIAAADISDDGATSPPPLPPRTTSNATSPTSPDDVDLRSTATPRSDDTDWPTAAAVSARAAPHYDDSERVDLSPALCNQRPNTRSPPAESTRPPPSDTSQRYLFIRTCFLVFDKR